MARKRTKSSVESLVIIHLSSLDSYADLEHEATGEYFRAYHLASVLESAILRHDGPVFIVDQAWLFVGKESWPRAGLIHELGISEEAYEITLPEEGYYEQRGPIRDISWIRFDEQDSEWGPFLKNLVTRLKRVSTDKVVLGGLYYEFNLSEGCVTYTYQYLRKRFPTTVDGNVVGCISDFYPQGSGLPGGYTRGSRR